MDPGPSPGLPRAVVLTVFSPFALGVAAQDEVAGLPWSRSPLEGPSPLLLGGGGGHQACGQGKPGGLVR